MNLFRKNISSDERHYILEKDLLTDKSKVHVRQKFKVRVTSIMDEKIDRRPLENHIRSTNLFEDFLEVFVFLEDQNLFGTLIPEIKCVCVVQTNAHGFPKVLGLLFGRQFSYKIKSTKRFPRGFHFVDFFRIII